MTFTFDPALAEDKDLVRFHIGDVHSDGYYLEDETINALITNVGSMEGAVISCIRFIITQLSQPDFRLDWMSVSNEAARQGFERMLEDKAAELGINLGAIASASVAVSRRIDSLETDDTLSEIQDEIDQYYKGDA